MTRFDPTALGVYVVTAGSLVPGRGHLEVARAAIEGGATAIQLRAPELDDDALLAAARPIGEACRRAGVLFVVNDRVEVAVEAGADGVHLGRADPWEGARDRLGFDRVLGLSVDDPAQAAEARDAGADYLGVTVWATPTKPEARPGGLEGLRAVVGATDLPVVGIGGIDRTNAAEVVAAGAAGVAVISAVAAAPDPVAAVRSIARAVAEGRSRNTRRVRGESVDRTTNGQGDR